MKISIIGAGHIGGALALGLARSGKVLPSEITVTAKHPESLVRFSEAGLRTGLDNSEAVKGADFVFIAVKPWLVEEVVRAIPFGTSSVVVSMAPGVSESAFASYLPEGQHLVYVIPNTAAEIGESMTYLSNVNASTSEIKALEDILSGVGVVRTVPMELMLAGTSLASCGIAYAMRFIDACAKAAEELGLSRTDALESACQTAKGAAALLSSKKADPEDEIRKVTTPGGLTQRGLDAMEGAGFSDSVGLAIKAVRK